MYSLAIADLQQMQLRLQQLTNTTYVLADQRALREILSTTIVALQLLYPDHLTYPQRVQLLHQLSLLEEEFSTSSVVNLTLPQWQHLHTTLQAAIENTLTNEATAPPFE